jgi:hypothetical protein
MRPRSKLEAMTSLIWIVSAITIFTLAGYECIQVQQDCSDRIASANSLRSDLASRIISNLR